MDERSLDIYEGFPHFYTKRKFKLDVVLEITYFNQKEVRTNSWTSD